MSYVKSVLGYLGFVILLGILSFAWSVYSFFKRVMSKSIADDYFNSVVQKLRKEAPPVNLRSCLPDYSNTNEMLKFDPLVHAEEITGSNYKEDKGAEALGFLLHMEHCKEKTEALIALGDTVLSNELTRYVEIITNTGFELALELPFTVQRNHDKVPRHEKFFIYAHRAKGIILAFDTYEGIRVNSGHIYYCWRRFEGNDGSYYGITSSGSWESEVDPQWKRNPKYNEGGRPEDLFWAGNHDAREALIYNIQRLSEAGTFLNPWPKNNMHLWLVHYGEHPEHGSNQRIDYDSLTKAKIKMLPDWAKEIAKGWRGFD